MRVYTTIIRTVIEYGAVVYHSSMTDEQDEEAVENLQNTALKMIFGSGISARKMREMSGLPTLRRRREELCDKFALKCDDMPQFSEWFKLKKQEAVPGSVRGGQGRSI